MSKLRNEILPGAGVWDCFFDKRVQAVLGRRRTVPDLQQPRLSTAAQQEFLAWPIIAFCIVDGLAQDLPTKVARHEHFLSAYAEDPTFVSRLLVEITNYHSTAESEKSLARRVAETSNRCNDSALVAIFGNGQLENTEDLALHDWKTIAVLLECNNSPAQLRTEFHREKRRRQGLHLKWSSNFAAWEQVERIRKADNQSVLPLHHVTLRS